MSKQASERGHAQHGHAHAHGNTNNLKIAFFLNLGFTVIEVIGGIATNSIAILSDAVHDLGDSISLGLAWYFDRYSKRGRTQKHTYGYRRFSLVGGLITGVFLLVSIGVVLWNAIPRLFSPEPVHVQGMLALAFVGVLFNGAAVLRLRRGTSLTERLVSWHLLEDVLGWIAILVGALVMMVWDLPIIDPILSIGISLFVFWNVWRSLRSVFQVFIQQTPELFDMAAFERSVLAQPKVQSMHHTHSWTVDGEVHVLTTHLVMDRDASREDVLAAKRRVRELLDGRSFEHLAVDVELEGESCLIGQGRDDAPSYRHHGH